MKKSIPTILIVLGIFFLLQSILGFFFRNRIFIRGGDYFAGAFKQGGIINHDIQLFNLSGSSMDFRAEPTCGCTLVDVPVQHIGPFSRCVVKAHINTEGNQLGKHTKAVVFYFHQSKTEWQQIAQIRYNIK